MSGKNFDVFISYRHSDGKDKAISLEANFEKAGCRTFRDDNELRRGAFDKKIEIAVLDAPVFVMVLTSDYFERCNQEGDWVRREIDLAIENGKVIIPINYNGVLKGVPDYLDEEFRKKVGCHTFIALHTDTSFKATLKEIIDNDIKPNVSIVVDNDPQPQPQPRPKPKPVQTDFNTEYNRCMTTEQYPEAFAACLNEAVLRQNVSSIKSKADNAIEKLKGRILIPDCVAHVSYDWLINRLSEKGYSPIKRHEDSISYKKIRFRISKAGDNKSEVKIDCSIKPFKQFLFWITCIGILLWFVVQTFDSFKFGLSNFAWFVENNDNSNYASFIYCFVRGILLFLILTSLIAILTRKIIYYFKRKKKAIQDVAKICLEECER